jgi:hypothetical protein
MALLDRPLPAVSAPVERSRRDEIAVVIFGSWMVFGLYLDGWAHRAQKPETFFSPWHGVLYSGFVAAVLYFATVGRTSPIPRDKIVARGFLLFVAGAIGDGIWHEIFGIEVNLETLLSPTHLALMIGGIAMVSGPLRLALRDPNERAESFRSFLPTTLSLALPLAVVSFFTMYVSAFMANALGDPRNSSNDFQASPAIGVVLITTALLVGPTMALVRRWETPMGTFTLTYGLVAVASAGAFAFDYPWHIVTGLVGGFAADVFARHDSRRTAVFRVGLVTPVAMWGTWFLVIKWTNWLTWTPELWTGTLILATFEGLALALLAVTPAVIEVRPDALVTEAGPEPPSVLDRPADGV